MHKIDLALPIRPCSKARPRVTMRGTYMPKAYQLWRKELGILVRQQWWSEPMLGSIALFASFHCKGKARGDLDNYIAGLLDGLQDTGIFANDKAVKRIEADLLEDTGRDYIRISLASLSNMC